jgi:uncharacterized SAM-binding protein YcdF (DUF218 family)
MFFLFSKLFSFVLNPLVWMCIVLLWAWRTKNDIRRRRLAFLAFWGLVICSNPFLLRVAYRMWEVEPVKITSPHEDPYDAAIVLGGFGNEPEKFKDRMNFGGSANRLTQALELYQQERVKAILITGGAPQILTKKRNEGVAAERFLKRIKFPTNDLLIERNSRNTFENSLNSASMLENSSLAHGRFLLMTDGWHMRRALSCFHKAGLDVLPFSTSGVGPIFGGLTPNRMIVPDPRGFELWQRLFKEIIGFIVYRISGKS